MSDLEQCFVVLNNKGELASVTFDENNATAFHQSNDGSTIHNCSIQYDEPEDCLTTCWSVVELVIGKPAFSHELFIDRTEAVLCCETLRFTNAFWCDARLVYLVENNEQSRATNTENPD